MGIPSREQTPAGLARDRENGTENVKGLVLYLLLLF